MYHCKVHLYLVGDGCRVFELVREMLPLEHFTHGFTQSSVPDKTLTAGADVIIFSMENLGGQEPKEALRTLLADKAKEARLILLAKPDQIDMAEDFLSEVFDIWTLPMTDAQIRFRFLRWQQSYKKEKDAWQTSQYLDAMIDHVPNLVWYKDKNGIHEKVNESFCQTVNKTKEQVQGRGHAYIWDVEQDDPVCIESENEVMSKRKTFVSEEIIRAGEEMRTLTTYKSPLYDLDGSVMGTVGVAIDVTQERAYEREIIRKNQSLESIFTSLDCGVICHSLDGTRILKINKAALRILGYNTMEEMVGGGFDMVAESVVEEDKDRLKENMEQLEKIGDSISVEYRIRHVDGEILHVMGNIKLLEEDGELYYQRFLLDCTAQKIQEKKKERRHMELIHALGADYYLICYFDLNTGTGSQIRNEDSHDSMFGGIFDEVTSLRENMERYIDQFVHEEDREIMKQFCAAERIKAELSLKRAYMVNYRAICGNEIKYFQIKIVRVGEWGLTKGIVVGFHSVDEETRAEMEKNNLLENALAQANRASKAKSVFLSNMSHDIRTPMNSIVGFTNLAISHIDNREQVEEYLKKIMTSGNHLLSLINDVLDMSRIESGRIHLDEKPCSLSEILHGLRNILQADVNAKQLDLQFDTVDVLDEDIYCDKLRLNQVLLNLLSNSVKYTRAGGSVFMRITEKAGAPAGYANYEFYIKDTGIGMSDEFVAHIFEPFEREQNSTISGIQGTGLGMAITKNIVDMMNGTIEVRSEQGRGSEFFVSFTFKLYAEAKIPQIITELQGCRALIVDDDYNTCDSVSYMMGQLGMRAEWTLSGKEAVLRTHQALTRGNDYGVYIIDWLLPDMNGIEVTRRIRKEVGDKAPILILTAYDWADIEEEAKEAGVTSFCSKPLFLSELRSSLQSAIETSEGKKKKDREKASKNRTGHILLAEDVELNQEIAVTILGDAGFTTEVADNGQIALDMIRKSEEGYYQLVLMDVQMPVMNGYEAAKAIRSLENKKLASIPIIAMTANAFEEDKQEALNAGMNGHIAKPFDIEKLLAMLDELLD